MAVRIHSITFDCADARALAGFWSAITGWNVYYDDDPEVVLAPCYPHDGTGWVTLADPEGNEFCIERGKAERGSPPPRSFRIGT